MKNVLKHVKKRILMVSMMITVLGFANEKSFFSVKDDAKRTVLTLSNVHQGNILSIIDNNGIVLYKEEILKNGTFTKGFDLTALPNGNYVFELDQAMEIKTIPFIVNIGKVNFKKQLEKSIYKPVIRFNNGLVYVTKLALDQEPLNVDIYFESTNGQELVFSETITGTTNISRVYRLTQSNEGLYKIMLNTNGKTFTKKI
ncbi:MAG: hypothetical protein ACK5MZ_11770 [Aestuariibaculum sp.]